jgi:predicted nucleic acid-binding protein
MVLTDTGYFFALANKKDDHHERAVELYSKYKSSLSTTWPVITETCHLLLAKMGASQQEKFINGLGKVKIFDLDKTMLARTESLMKKYRDLPMDLADASLVIMAENTNVGNILSVDYRDFGAYRWKNRKPFNNLMLVD